MRCDHTKRIILKDETLSIRWPYRQSRICNIFPPHLKTLSIVFLHPFLHPHNYLTHTHRWYTENIQRPSYSTSKQQEIFLENFSNVIGINSLRSSLLCGFSWNLQKTLIHFLDPCASLHMLICSSSSRMIWWSIWAVGVSSQEPWWFLDHLGTWRGSSRLWRKLGKEKWAWQKTGLFPLAPCFNKDHYLTIYPLNKVFSLLTKN